MFRLSILFTGAVSLLVCACGSAGQNRDKGYRMLDSGEVEPASETEKRILEAASTLDEGQSKNVDGLKVEIVAEYFAASGRECRSVSIFDNRGDQNQSKLICRFESGWGYAPKLTNPPRP